MKSLINTYCLLLGVILGIGVIYSGTVIKNPVRENANQVYFQAAVCGFSNHVFKTPGSDNQKFTFHSQNFGSNWNNNNYYQEQNIVLSQKNNRSRLGFYAHLKI